MTVENYNGMTESLQVSFMRDVPAQGSDDVFKTGAQFLVKNITDSELSLEVRLRGAGDYITTKFYPGWNPEIVQEIKGAVTADTIQIGY